MLGQHFSVAVTQLLGKGLRVLPLLFLITSSAWGALPPLVHTWTGGGGNASWNTAANWDTGSVPGVSDSVVIPNGTFTIDIISSVTIANLTLGPASGIGPQVLKTNGNGLTVTGVTTVNNTGELDVVGDVSLGQLTNFGTIKVLGDAMGMGHLQFSTFSNFGTLELDANPGNSNVDVRVSGPILNNQSGGTIVAKDTVGSGGGTRTLDCTVVNDGSIIAQVILDIVGTDRAHQNLTLGSMVASTGAIRITQNGTSPSFVNTGLIQVLSGQVFEVIRGSFNNLGTINAPVSKMPATSRITFRDVSLTGAYVADSVEMNCEGSCSLVGSTSVLTVQSKLLVQGSLDIDSLSQLNTTQFGVIDIVGTASGVGQLTINATSWSNAGTINFTSTADQVAKLIHAGGGTLTNSSTGLLVFLAGAGGERLIEADLTNQGTVEINTLSSLKKSGASHVNATGAAIIANAGVLKVETHTSFTNSGSINTSNGGTVAFMGGTFDSTDIGPPAKAKAAGFVVLENADIINTFFVNNSTLVLINVNIVNPAGIDNAGTLEIKGTAYSEPSGIVNQGTVEIRGTTEFGHALLSFSDDWINNGLVSFHDESGQDARLDVNSGQLLHNASNGTLDMTSGTGSRTLHCLLKNDGILNVHHNTALSSSGDVEHQNGGTLHIYNGGFAVLLSAASQFTNLAGKDIIVDATGQLLIDGGTFQQDGNLTIPSVSKRLPVQFAVMLDGTLLDGMLDNSGYLRLKDTTIDTTGTLNNSGLVKVHGSANVVNGTLTNTGTITLEAQATDGPSVLALESNTANGGNIELVSENADSATLGGNAILTNTSTGNIHALSGSVGDLVIGVQLTNEGTLQVDDVLQISSSRMPCSNSGVIDVTTNGLSVYVGSSGSLVNSGLIKIHPEAEMAVVGVASGTDTFDNTGGSITDGSVARDKRGVPPGQLILQNVIVEGPVTNSIALILLQTIWSNGSSLNNQAQVFVFGYNSFSGTSFQNQVGAHLELVGDATNGNAQIYLPSFTNEGRINLTSDSAGHSAYLSVPILTNAASRMIEVTGTPGIAREFAGRLINQGTLSVLQNLDLAMGDGETSSNQGLIHINDGITLQVKDTTAAAPRASLVNIGSVEIDPTAILGFTDADLVNDFVDPNRGSILGQGTVDVVGDTFTQRGRLEPGSGPGTLSVLGDVTFEPSSILELDITGLTLSTQYDQLNVTGTATLDGSINVAYAGFTPTTGNTFSVLDVGAVSGSFTAVNATASNGNILVLEDPLSAPLIDLTAGPGAIQWISAADGDWNDPANWSGNTVPGPCSLVDITLPGTYTVTLGSAVEVYNLALGGASGTQTLALAGRDLYIQSSLTVNSNGVLIADGSSVGLSTTVCRGLPRRGATANFTNDGSMYVYGASRIDIPFSNSGFVFIEGLGGVDASLSLAYGTTNSGDLTLTDSGGGTAHLELDSGTFTNDGSVYAQSGAQCSMQAPISNNSGGSFFVNGSFDVTPANTVVVRTQDLLAPTPQTIAYLNLDDEADHLTVRSESEFVVDAGGSAVIPGAFNKARQLDGLDDEIDLRAVRQQLASHDTWSVGWFSRSVSPAVPALQLFTHAFKAADQNLTDGRWHHFFLSWDGQTLTSYRDGAVSGSLALSQDDAAASLIDQVRFGRQGQQAQAGIVDELSFSASLPSAEELSRVTELLAIANNPRWLARMSQPDQLELAWSTQGPLSVLGPEEEGWLVYSERFEPTADHELHYQTYDGSLGTLDAVVYEPRGEHLWKMTGQRAGQRGAGSFSNSGGISLGGGTLTITSNSIENLSTGTISGYGDIDVSGATFNQSGRLILSPPVILARGLQPMMQIMGDVSFGSNSLLDFQGISPTNLPSLGVSGTLTLGGTVEMGLNGSFTPVGGELFDLITATNIAGTFTTETLPTMPVNFTAETNLTSTLYQLELHGPVFFDLDSATYLTLENSAVLKRAATLSVVRGGDTSLAVDVDWEAVEGGTATGDVDFALSKGTLHFNPGDTVISFEVVINDDRDVEGDETFTVNLLNPVGGTIGTGAATVTIQDVEEGQFDMDASTYTVREDAGTLDVVVNRTNGADGAVSVILSMTDGTAFSGQDYSGFNQTLTWTDGDSSSRTVSIPILDDTDFEGDEDFTVLLTTPTGNAIIGSLDQSVVTITDVELGHVEFSQADYSASEDAGMATIELNRVGGSDGILSISFNSADGTAVEGEDYTDASQVVSFPDGNSDPILIDVPLLDDSVAEDDETVLLSLLQAKTRLPLTSATLTILNDDQPGTILLTSDTFKVAEDGGSITIDLVREGGADGSVTVNFTTGKGSATAGTDYTAFSGTVEFPDTITTVGVAIPIHEDLDVEGPETFTVDISSPTGGASIGSPSNGTVTIQDNDVPPGEIRFVGSNFSGVEDSGTISFFFERVNGDGGDVSVTFTTLLRSPGPGNAQPGLDFVPTTQTVTWIDGASGTTVVEVPVVDDSIPEPTETFDVQIHTPTGGVILGTPSQATGTIQDDDGTGPGTIALLGLPSFVGEAAGSVNFEVQRIGGSEGEVVVLLETVDGSAEAGQDFTAISEQLVWPAFDATPKPFTLAITADTLAEGVEDLAIRVSLVSGQVNGVPTSQRLQILDDDSSLVRFRSRSDIANEGDGSYAVEAILETPASTAFDVDVTIAANSSASGDDYSLATQTLSFASGSTNAFLTVDLVDDNLVEANEFVSFSLVPGTSQIGSPSSFTLNIQDNDETVLNWSVMPESLVEGSASKANTSVTIQAELSQPFSRRTVVNFQIGSDSTAVLGLDYQIPATQLAFEAGETTAQLALVLVDDQLVEGEELLILSLPEQPGVLLGDRTEHRFTITDNDALSVSWSEGRAQVVEDDAAKRSVGISVVAELSALSDQPVQVAYTVSGLASFGTDHDLADGTLTFPAGASEAVLEFNVLGDRRLEFDEDVVITLVSDDIAIGHPDTHTLVIRDDDLNEGPDTDIAVLAPANATGPVLVVARGDVVTFGGIGIESVPTPPYTFRWEICDAAGCEQFDGETRDFTFPEVGIYRVYCAATDVDGNTDLTPKGITIQVRPTLPPDVEIVSPAQEEVDVLVGSTVEFVGTVENAGKREVSTSWYLQGEGNFSSPGLTYSRVFDTVGTFNIIFEATDGVTSDSESRTVNVYEGEEPMRVSIAHPANGASYTANQKLLMEGVISGGGSKRAHEMVWVWEYDRGSEYEGQVGNVEFTKTGRQRVDLRVFENMGTAEQPVRGNLVGDASVIIFVQDPTGVPELTFGFPTNLRVQPGGGKRGESCIFMNSIVLNNKGYEDLTFAYDVPGARLNHETPGQVCFDQEGEYTINLFAITPTGVQSAVERRTVLVKASTDGEFEPNNTLGNAAEIIPGDYDNLTLDEADEADHFRVTVPENGQRLLVALSVEGEAYLDIFDQHGNRVGESRPVVGSESVSLAGLDAGEYFLKISQPNANKRRGLSMSISVSVLNPALYIPDVRTNSSYESQIGIVNPVSEITCLEVVGFAKDGTIVDEVPLELGPKARAHFEIEELFGNLSSAVAWVQVDSIGDVLGYARTNSRDQIELTAVSANRELHSELHVPHIAEKTAEWYTRAAVINGDASGISGSVELPVVNTSKPLELDNAFGQDVFEFVDRFENELPTTQLWATMDNQNRTAALAGIEEFGTLDSTRRSASLALSDVRRDNPQFTFVQNNLYFTHIARGDFFTGLALVNLGGLQQGVLIHAYRDNGTEAGDGFTRILAPNEKLLTSAADLITAMGENPDEIAWLLVEADADITGFELFGTTKGLAGMEASRGLRPEICYPFVDTNPNVSHGISAVNVNRTELTVDFTLYDNSGAEIGATTVTLAPQQKYIGQLSLMFPNLGGKTPGWLSAVSKDESRPLAGFEIFINGNQMGAVIAE